jgi:hypothetical protein
MLTWYIQPHKAFSYSCRLPAAVVPAYAAVLRLSKSDTIYKPRRFTKPPPTSQNQSPVDPAFPATLGIHTPPWRQSYPHQPTDPLSHRVPSTSPIPARLASAPPASLSPRGAASHRKLRKRAHLSPPSPEAITNEAPQLRLFGLLRGIHRLTPSQQSQSLLIAPEGSDAEILPSRGSTGS